MSSGLFSISIGDMSVKFVGVVIVIGDRSLKFNSVLFCFDVVGVCGVELSFGCCACIYMYECEYSSRSYS